MLKFFGKRRIYVVKMSSIKMTGLNSTIELSSFGLGAAVAMIKK